jgi:SSS family solute:Na+ symporter
MAVSTMIILVGVPTASVIYSGAKVISVYFAGMTVLGLDLGNIAVGCWIIGIFSAVYVFAGGLKACAWADLLQGSALVAGGAVVMALALQALGAADPAALVSTAVTPGLDPAQLTDAGAWERIRLLNGGALPAGKLHMVRPASDPSVPWTALVVGLWIPNFFYWGLNQYITQRTLGAKSLAEGQRGVVFAALLKLVIPFIVVFPGIMAFNLFNSDMRMLGADKNKPVMEAFARGDALLYAFDAPFAKLNPATATGMLAGNAALVGSTAGAPDTPEEIAAANDTLLNAAGAAGKTVATRLIGYDYDAAFPLLLKLVPRNGLLGFVLVALFGAVVSSLAAMLNAASTIATMDIYRKVRTGASQYELVTTGRVCIVLFTLVGILIAPQLGRPEFGGIFTFIQEFQGFISPGILAIFVFGLLVHRAPRLCGTVGLLLNPILYGALKYGAPDVAFLDRMAICFAVVVGVLGLITVLKPMPKPVELPVNPTMNMTVNRGTKIFGGVVVALTLVLYAIFW